MVKSFENDKIDLLRLFTLKNKFYSIWRKIFQIAFYMSPFTLLLFYWKVDYVTISIVVLYTYLSRVAYVFGINQNNVYTIVCKRVAEEKEAMINKMFR